MMEEFLIYAGVGLLCFVIVFIYIKKLKNESNVVEAKIIKAKEGIRGGPQTERPDYENLREGRAGRP